MASYELAILTKAKGNSNNNSSRQKNTLTIRFELGNGVKLKDISPMNLNEIVYEIRIYRYTVQIVIA